MDLRKLSDRALDARIEKLSTQWLAAYDVARHQPGYRDLRPSELRMLPADDPLHALYADMVAINALQFEATDHRAARRTYGSAWMRRKEAA